MGLIDEAVPREFLLDIARKRVANAARVVELAKAQAKATRERYDEGAAIALDLELRAGGCAAGADSARALDGRAASAIRVDGSPPCAPGSAHTRSSATVLVS